MATVDSSGDEEGDADLGRYYHQAAGDNHNLVSLPAAVGQDTEDTVEDEQTVTLVPSQNSNGEVSCVLVVQHETKRVLNITVKIERIDEEEEKCNYDVNNFEDEKLEEEPSDDKVEADRRPKPRNRSKFLRPKYTCKFCEYTSPKWCLFLRHMKSHSEDHPHKCCVCGRVFNSVASLKNHVNIHNGVKPHVCKYCTTPFTTLGAMNRHVRYKHTHEKPHKCTECDYAAVELSKLRRHVRCHTGERPYQCPHCTHAFADTFKLKRHLRTHTGEKPYKCDRCNVSFAQSNALKAHALIHDVAKKLVYKCELCPVKCGRKTELRNHVQKQHTSDKPLKCKWCCKYFPDRYTRKLHNKTHKGEKCYKCHLCPYASTLLQHVKTHMLKHTNEKPFVCDHCDQSFRHKQLLQRHTNLYHNPDYVPKPPKEKTHACHECNRMFARKGNLIRHLAVHDPDSGHREQALALKMGRQRKAEYVEGQIIENVENQEEHENAERGEGVTVADGDSQNYVVVIQLVDSTEQIHVAAPDVMEENKVEEDEEEEVDEEALERKYKQDAIQKAAERNIKLEKDVDTCFGFDEEEEEVEEEDFNNKVMLRLV